MDCGVVVRGHGEWRGVRRQYMVDNVIARKRIDTPDEFKEGMEKKRQFLHEIATKGKVLYG